MILGCQLTARKKWDVIADKEKIFGSFGVKAAADRWCCLVTRRLATHSLALFHSLSRSRLQHKHLPPGGLESSPEDDLHNSSSHHNRRFNFSFLLNKSHFSSRKISSSVSVFPFASCFLLFGDLFKNIQFPPSSNQNAGSSFDFVTLCKCDKSVFTTL